MRSYSSLIPFLNSFFSWFDSQVVIPSIIPVPYFNRLETWKFIVSSCSSERNPLSAYSCPSLREMMTERLLSRSAVRCLTDSFKVFEMF